MGRTSREKGKAGERELARILRENGIDARRGIQYNGADGSADVVGIEGIHAEVKRVEGMKVGTALLRGAMEQAERDAGAEAARTGREVFPVVFFRQSREGWKAAMYAYELCIMCGTDAGRGHGEIIVLALRDWMAIYKEHMGHGEAED